MCVFAAVQAAVSSAKPYADYVYSHSRHMAVSVHVCVCCSPSNSKHAKPYAEYVYSHSCHVVVSVHVCVLLELQHTDRKSVV